MQIRQNESQRKGCVDNFQLHYEITDRAAQQISEKFALTLPHAREIARLAGLGGEARS